MSEKSNQQQLNERVLEVSRLMLMGWTSKKIVQYSAENWNVEERQTRKYIAKAYTMWHAEYKKRLKAGLDYHMAMRIKLYEEAYKGKVVKVTKFVKGQMVTIERIEDQDFRLCLEIAKDIAKLEGLYVERFETKNEVTVNILGEDEDDDKKE